MWMAVLETLIAAGIIAIIALVFRQPHPRAFIYKQLPTFRSWLGTPDLVLPQRDQKPSPADNLPSLDDLNRWRVFIGNYRLVAAPLGHVNLWYESVYAEMAPHLSGDVRKRVEGMTGIGLAFNFAGDPADEIKRLLFRDLEMVQRKVFKADPYSDDEGYFQWPPQSP